MTNPRTWKFLQRSSIGKREFEFDRYTDGSRRFIKIQAHCLACAKMELVTRYGGKVDTRGWQRQGGCGLILHASQQGEKAND